MQNSLEICKSFRSSNQDDYSCFKITCLETIQTFLESSLSENYVESEDDEEDDFEDEVEEAQVAKKTILYDYSA